MQSRNRSYILNTILLVALGIGMLFQAGTINKLRSSIDKDKLDAITKVENLYKDSIRLSNGRIKILTAKYDSVSSVKSIRKEAIKINKKKSDEKVAHIFSANDSTLQYISDSTLSANGFHKQ